MIERRVVCAKLAQLRERQETLKKLAAESKQVFVGDPVKVGAAERLLQVSIEICLDVGHHLIAKLGLPRPNEYRDVLRILGEHGALTPDLASRLEKAAAFRNRLVHVYGNIDAGHVHDFLEQDRGNFDELARAVAALVKTQGPEEK